MSKDPTFRVLGQAPTRSERYQAYRREWDRREADLDASDHPVHVDLETVAVCDLRCGSSEEDPQGFCQIWTHEHIRTQGFDEHTYQRGYMDPVLYGRLLQQCADMGVSSIKLNYRGEPSLHPRIVSFVREAAELGFPDIMMNTNGNGGARKNPELFAQLVDAGITDLANAATAASGLTITAANVPRTGLDTDTVKTQMAALAVSFFSAKLARAAGGDVGGTVPATLALTVGGPASFGAFAPGVDREYVATAPANVISTAGNAALSVSDPGYLANGTFSLAEALRVELSKAAWTAPVSNDPVTITFRQHIAATQPLRTGSYSRTLTFTLSTTAP